MDTPAPPPFEPGPAPGARAAAPRSAASQPTTPPPVPHDVRTVPPAGPRGRDLRRMLPLALGALALVALIMFLAGRDGGVGAARNDLEQSAEVLREKEREVAAAQQTLEEKLADLQAARAQVQASAVKLNAETTKERRDARDTMVAGGEIVGGSDAERRAAEALRRSEAALREGQRP